GPAGLSAEIVRPGGGLLPHANAGGSGVAGVDAWASSQPTPPPPRTARRPGRSSRSQTASPGRTFLASARPGTRGAPCARAAKARLAAPGAGHAEPVGRDNDVIVIVIGGGLAGSPPPGRDPRPGRARCCVPSKTLIEAAARGAAFTEATAAVHKAVAAIAAT